MYTIHDSVTIHDSDCCIYYLDRGCQGIKNDFGSGMLRDQECLGSEMHGKLRKG